MKTHRIMTSKTWGPVDIEEDSGNPFEGFRGKMDMRSRWVSVEGICWQLPLGSLRASTLAPPHAAVPDNIITAGALR